MHGHGATHGHDAMHGHDKMHGHGATHGHDAMHGHGATHGHDAMHGYDTAQRTVMTKCVHNAHDATHSHDAMRGQGATHGYDATQNIFVLPGSINYMTIPTVSKMSIYFYLHQRYPTGGPRLFPFDPRTFLPPNHVATATSIYVANVMLLDSNAASQVRGLRKLVRVSKSGTMVSDSVLLMLLRIVLFFLYSLPKIYDLVEPLLNVEWIARLGYTVYGGHVMN